MSANTVTIRADEEDRNSLMNECKQLFLEEHPEMEGYEITQRFMFKKVIKFYLKE